MFAILEILPDNNPKRKRFRRRYEEAEIFLEEISGESFKKYYIIRARKQHGGIPWEEIEEVCGRCKKRLIVQDNIELPENGGMERYIPSDFPALLMMNTAEDILRRLHKKEPRLSCALIDKNGNAAELAEKLIPYTPTLKIYTGNLKKYYSAAEKIFEKFGASLIISDEAEIINGADFTVSLNNDSELYPQTGFVLAYRRQKDGKTLSLGKIDLPAEYYLPPIEGINRFDFICALYELAGAKNLGELYTNTLFYDSREINIKSVPELIINTRHIYNY